MALRRRLTEITSACKMLRVVLARSDSPATVCSSSSRSRRRMPRPEATPLPAFKVQVFSIKRFASTCRDFAFLLHFGQQWPIWISGRFSSPLSLLLQGSSFYTVGFYSWIICQRHGPRILTLYRFSCLHGPVLGCHPAALPPLQPSAAGRKCL